MRKSVSGSSLLLVLLITTMLTLCFTNIWRSTTYMMDIVYKRQEYEHLFRATEGLINYGIALCKENFHTFIKKAEEGMREQSIGVGLWPPGNTYRCTGRLKIEVHSAYLKVYALVTKKDNEPFTISCILKKSEALNKNGDNPQNHQLVVSEWTIHA